MPALPSHPLLPPHHSQAPKKVTKKPAKKAAKAANPLFVAEPRSFRVGGAIRVRSKFSQPLDGLASCDGRACPLCVPVARVHLLTSLPTPNPHNNSPRAVTCPGS